MLQFIRRYWPSIAVVAVILYATLASNPLPDNAMPMIPYIDKLIHAIMMGGLTGAIAFDYQRIHSSAWVLSPRTMLVIAAGVLIFSALDEWLQSTFTADRSGDIIDLLADTLGILVALLSAPPTIRHLLKIK